VKRVHDAFLSFVGPPLMKVYRILQQYLVECDMKKFEGRLAGEAMDKCRIGTPQLPDCAGVPDSESTLKLRIVKFCKSHKMIEMHQSSVAIDMKSISRIGRTG